MENYKEKYEDALERARVWKEKSGMPVDKQGILDDIFPELKESDDEKIKNEIIDYLKGFIPHHNDDLVAKSKLWIAWLEKQGEQKPKKVSIWKHWKDGIAGNGEGKLVYLVKSGNTYRLSSCLGFECDYIELSDLDKLYIEKQGEQSHCNGEVNDEALQQQLQIWFDKGKCSGRDEVIFHPENFGLQKQGEQKPADKVEPKFKIGDWIVSNRTNKTYKIDSINTKDANYIIYSCVPSVYTNEDSPCFSESMIHLWTIQDAKDGDIIANGDMVLIFKCLEEPSYRQHIIAHIGLDINGNIQVTNESWNLGLDWAKPATKEQRDLLFSKMKEAGYEWDAEKKELKKIEESNPTENTCKISDCAEKVDMTEYNNGYECGKQRVLKYPKEYGLCKKYAWSEEDEKMRTCCEIAIDFFKNLGKNSSGHPHPNYFDLDEKIYPERVIDWLKSLKERMKGE